jgi:hypothetical protein
MMPLMEKKPGRPKSNFKNITKTSQIGTKINETRATFIVNEEQLELIKMVAYWERITMKTVVFEAFESYLNARPKYPKRKFR